jgi:hypothetical protein
MKTKLKLFKSIIIKIIVLFISYNPSFSQDTTFHIVKKGETLYSISKVYDVEVKLLKKQNYLSSNELSLNQKIFIKKNNVNSKNSSDLEKKTKKEEGFAATIDEFIESDKYLALHKTAEVGVIIFVKNQMNGNVVIVRVVGKLPDTGINAKISIRLSSIAFEKLDAKDTTIPVELTYVK